MYIVATFQNRIIIQVAMNAGKYIFSQIVEFLPQRQFERIVKKYTDIAKNWRPKPWAHLLALIFGQLAGCRTMRELTDITTAHAAKSYHLGMGSEPVSRSSLSRVSMYRDYRMFEEFAFHMVRIAQDKRVGREFRLYGRFYAFDSSTIDLCMKLFDWATFRSRKSGIKLHTQIDIVTNIPTFFSITNADVHDVNAMDEITYEALACYIFDRGYWDLARLFHIGQVNSFFVIREKGKPVYEIVEGEDTIEEENVLRDQTVRFTGKYNARHYPTVIRRIVYYASELRRTFVYYTNNFYLKASDIAFLYKNRWQVELFFKWIKQHLRVKSFWGNTENAVRIQIYAAIITYCLMAIIEHDLNLNRNIYEVMRVLGCSLLTKDSIKELFAQRPEDEDVHDMHDMQLQIEFKYD